MGCAGLVEFVDVFHESGDSGIETVAVDIFGNLFDDFVAGDNVATIFLGHARGRSAELTVLGRGRFRCLISKNKVPTTVEEAIDASYRARVPSGVELDWADKHFVGAESVGAVAVVNNIERINNVTFTFAHLFAIWGVDVAVID